MTQTVVLYPSWFGTDQEARKAASEQAANAARYMGRRVISVVVDFSNPICWLVTTRYSELR